MNFSSFGRAMARGPRAIVGALRQVCRLLSTGRTSWGQDPDAEAEKIALQLLNDVLGVSSRQLAQCGYLEIRSNVFQGVVYRLRLRQPVEVREGAGLRPVGRLCVVVRAGVPAADELLAKALWLQADEVGLLKVGQRLA